MIIHQQRMVCGWMDGLDGQRDRQTDGQMDKQTDKHIDIWMNGHAHYMIIIVL